MRILALDAALARCSAAIVADGVVLAVEQAAGGRGQAAALPPMLRAVLARAGLRPEALDGVAVTVGPGSFTGLRAALALAQGFALAAGRPVVGVTVAEALADRLRGRLGGRALWVAIDSRRGRVFLERGDGLVPVALDALPPAAGPVAVAGDAAIAVAARLAARGDDVMLTDARLPEPAHVAAVGARRLRGEIGACPAQPVYVDPPEATLPAGGLRPAPQGAGAAGGMMAATLLPAGPVHADALGAIHAASFPPAERWTPAALGLCLAQPGVFGFVDPEGGMVLARLAADEAEILTLAVAPALRRQGRGRALLGAAMARAAAAGAAALLLEVSSENGGARALYAAAGFREVGRRRRYYADGSDAVVMRCALPAPVSCPGAAAAG